MSRRGLIFLVLIAIAGYGAFFLLSPRSNPSASWQYQLDRKAAIERARQFAVESGIDARDWKALVKTNYQGQTGYFLSKYPASGARAMLSPILTEVSLAEPGSTVPRFRAVLRADGRVDSYSLRLPSNNSNQPAADAPQSTEEARKQAESALVRLTGNEASNFSLASEVNQGADGLRYIWERTLAGEDDFKLQVSVNLKNSQVTEAKLITSMSPRFQDEYNSRRNSSRLPDLLQFLIIILTILALTGFHVYNWARGRINHKQGLLLLALIVVLGVIRAVTGTGLDDQMGKAFEIGAAQRSLLAVALSLVVPILFYGLMLAIIWVNGRAFERISKRSKLATIAGLIKGKVTTKLIAGRISAGILLGGLLAGIPAVVAGIGLFPGMITARPDPSILVARQHVPAILIQQPYFAYWLTFALGSTFVGAYFAKSRFARILLMLIGFALLLDDTVFETSTVGAITIAALAIAAAWQIFKRFDMLTLIAAGMSADAVYAASSIMIQPSGSLRAAGIKVLASLGGLLCLGLLISWKGWELQIEELTETTDLGDSSMLRAERERLRAEFGIARQAQQRMLPDVPPRLPGFDIAATCRPAKEVGGDLFDFLVLPNERIGVVVADVSGKGVPAALYMTLTKGLLASVAENHSDPAIILQEVNHHLYQVCKRKVFVTMLFGVLDPAALTFTYVRAGHNPGIWRRAGSRSAEMLRSGGLGLGLSSNNMFNKTIKAETIKIERGDALLLYSDGITEAMNTQGEEYGENRLVEIISTIEECNAIQTQEAILADVNSFLGGTAPQDDMTLVVLRAAEA